MHRRRATFSEHAHTVADFIRQHGAAFFGDIVSGTRLLRCQVEDALAELVAQGMANSDCFGGLRCLLVPSAQRKPFAGAKRRHRTAPYGMDEAGRWAIIAVPSVDEATTTEHIARCLLRRYGVVFWRLLEREAARLPPWRELLRAYRRLESRGEISRWSLRCRHPRRAVRLARSRRAFARDATQAARRQFGVNLGGRPTQPCRHPHART